MADGAGSKIAETLGDIAAKAGDAALDELKNVVNSTVGQVAPTNSNQTDEELKQREMQDKQESDEKMQSLRLELHQKAQQLGVTHTPTVEEVREQQAQQDEVQDSQTPQGLGEPALPGSPQTGPDLSNIQVTQSQTKMERGRMKG